MARLTNPAVIGNTVKLGIAPDALTTDAIEGGATISAKVDFTEPFPRFTAVYSDIAGKSTFLVAKHALDAEIKSGTKLTYYVNPEDIQLFDAETGEKLLAFFEITDNTVSAKVQVKDNNAIVSFGKTKLVVPNGAGALAEGETELTLGYTGYDCTAEAVKANPKAVIAGVVEDADVLGDTTIIKATVAGVAPYFTAIVPGVPKINIGDKIKFAYDVTALLGATKEETDAE